MNLGRRRLSKLLLGTCLAGLLPDLGIRAAASEPPRTKLIIVLFGGGTRGSESMDDPSHRYIPRLWNDLVPRGTLFTNMRVEGRVVHPNSAGSIVTGHWEWDDLDWARPVEHPTVFEMARRARSLPDTSAWAFVYASILAGTSESRDGAHGVRFGANVVEPPTIPRATADEMERLLERARASGSWEAQERAVAQCASLARETSTIARSGLRSPAARELLDRQYQAWKTGNGTTSHDAFLTTCAVACMRQFAPDVMAMMYGEIDAAHYGSWSRYVEAIGRTDALTWRIYREAQALPAYRGRTLLLILPDHGRQLGDAWAHHGDFYTDQDADEGCRRVWMLALGPGVVAGHRIERAVPITSVASTGLEYLGLEASRGAAPSAWQWMRQPGPAARRGEVGMRDGLSAQEQGASPKP